MTTEFNLLKVNKLNENQAHKYIIKYFVPLSNGNHAVLISDVSQKYVIMDNSTVKQVYFNRMYNHYWKFYSQHHKEIKSLTCELNKPVFYDNYLNICPQLKYQYNGEEMYGHYNEIFDDEDKAGVNKMLKFIKEVINNNNEEHYNYMINWIANMVQGNKNSSCVYLKGAQGLGKSTLVDFLSKYVIGEELSLESGSEPLTSKFNAILEGKLMVFFEELENFSVAQWTSISSTLKRIITSDNYIIEKKGINSYTTKNINNYFILSNNDAIRDDDGRRYFICDLSTKYKQNIDYFSDL